MCRQQHHMECNNGHDNIFMDRPRWIHCFHTKYNDRHSRYIYSHYYKFKWLPEYLCKSFDSEPTSNLFYYRWKYFYLCRKHYHLVCYSRYVFLFMDRPRWFYSQHTMCYNKHSRYLYSNDNRCERLSEYLYKNFDNNFQSDNFKLSS